MAIWYHFQPHSVECKKRAEARIEGVLVPAWKRRTLVLQGVVLASGGIGQGDGASELPGYSLDPRKLKQLTSPVSKNRTALLSELPAAAQAARPPRRTGESLRSTYHKRPFPNDIGRSVDP